MPVQYTGTDMRPYTTKHDDDLRLGASGGVTAEGCSCGATLREWIAVLNERLQHAASSVRDLADRVSISDGRAADGSNRLGGLESRVGGMDVRLGAVETRLSAVETRIGAVELRLGAVECQLGVVEERLSHTATKTWVLGCAVALLIAMLTGTLGGVWWMLQQYIAPLLRASAG
jgi:hypothetical protein